MVCLLLIDKEIKEDVFCVLFWRVRNMVEKKSHWETLDLCFYFHLIHQQSSVASI